MRRNFQLPLSFRSARERPRLAYTLIEIVGVLAILGLLTTVAISSVMTRIKITQRQNEKRNLDTLADGLCRSILRTRTVPSTNTWVDALVTELALPLNKVQQNASGNLRRLFIDPAIRLGTNSTQVLPWAQTQAGATNLASVRALFVSSLWDELPAMAGDVATFSNLWNTAADGVPAGWAASWAAHGPDIKIRQVDLSTLFHLLVLEDEDGLRTAPYSINTTNTLTTVTAASGRVETYFLHGTPINLHFYPDPASASIVVQGREYIVADTSYVFENGCWGRYLQAGPNLLAGSFGQMVDVFRVASVSGTCAASATPQSAVDAMYTYLLYAALYSENGAPSDTPTPPVTPHLRMAYDAQLQVSLISSNLLK